MKQCSCCNQMKPLSEYPFDKRRDYHQTICKECKHYKEAQWRALAKQGKAYQPKKGAAPKRNKTTKSYYLPILIEHQNNLCALCTAPFGTGYSLSPSIDHKVPVIKGGSDKLSNLQAVHRRCNNIKSIHVDTNRVEALIKGRWGSIV